MNVKLTAKDHSFLSSLGIFEDDAELNLDPELGSPEEITGIAFGMLREEQRESRKWRNVAFAWCTVAVISTAVAVAMLALRLIS